MKTLKIALALAAIIGLTTLTIGLALAHFTSTPYAYNNTAVPVADEDWWNRMQDYMEARWNGIEDEEWFNDMTQYMEEHWNEVQNQEWFNQMLQYMQDHGYHSYGYESYGYGPYGYGPYGYNNYDSYYGPRSYGRGFGCMGW
jgi:hypothetical protein